MIIGCKPHDDETQELRMNNKVGIEDRIKLTMYGYEAVSRTVSDSGSSGAVYLPKRLIGKKVTVIFVEA